MSVVLEHLMEIAQFEKDSNQFEKPGVELSQLIVDRERIRKYQKIGLPVCKKPRVIEQCWVELPGTTPSYGQSFLIGWSLVDAILSSSSQSDHVFHLEVSSSQELTSSWERLYAGPDEECRVTVGPGRS